MNGIPVIPTLEDAPSANHITSIERKEFIIYKITNLVNGKIYIGQTCRSIEVRMNQHRKRAMSINQPNQAIHRAMKKYGMHNFTHKVLCYCYSKHDADKTERELIVSHNSMVGSGGYNMTSGGEGSLNCHPNDVTRTKIRLANLGKKQSDEQRAKYNRKGDHNPQWGKTHSVETREKMSTKAKLRIGNKNPFFGKTHSEEAKEKIRIANVGRVQSAEQKAKYNRKGENHPLWGTHRSQATKDKISATKRKSN